MKETAETKKRIDDIIKAVKKVGIEAGGLLIEQKTQKRYLSIKSEKNLGLIELMAFVTLEAEAKK